MMASCPCRLVIPVNRRATCTPPRQVHTSARRHIVTPHVAPLNSKIRLQSRQLQLQAAHRHGRLTVNVRCTATLPPSSPSVGAPTGSGTPRHDPPSTVPNKVNGTRMLSPVASAAATTRGESATRINHRRSNSGSMVTSGAPRRPSSIADISNGDHILGFGADLAPDHPGFHDVAYKQRRSFISDLAKTHRIGEPIPSLPYSKEETAVWSHVLTRLQQLYPSHACSPFLRALPLFSFSPSHIPQLQTMSDRLLSLSGWRIRPVAGLLHPRDFLNGLAFNYFHSTQYIRHPSNPLYTPEPDLCHELLGHVPMLADPNFSRMVQAIGQASLGASEEEIWHLTKLYWYTVEFGTVMEGGEVRAFGAGLLSSVGELQHMKALAATWQEQAQIQELAQTQAKAQTRPQAQAHAQIQAQITWRRSNGEMPASHGRSSADGKKGTGVSSSSPPLPSSSPPFLPLDPFSPLPRMSYKDGYQRAYFLCNSFDDVADKLLAYAARLLGRDGSRVDN